ncbi:MAG: hypothetical protein DRP87_19040 [Spirochaetes bacterium]|nr:MAG: hypothetical protein DRP87_19040 [Spirochaetota bacterium]
MRLGISLPELVRAPLKRRSRNYVTTAILPAEERLPGFGVAFYIFMQRYIIKGITSGALKG